MKIKNIALPWSFLVEGENNRISPKLKQVWNVAIHVQHNFLKVGHKNNSLPLGLIQPSSPSSKELHGYDKIYLWHWLLGRSKVGYSRVLVQCARSMERFVPSSDVMSTLKIFQLKSSIFERPRDVTWWKKPVFHGARAFDRNPEIANGQPWVDLTIDGILGKKNYDRFKVRRVGIYWGS